MQMEPAVRTRIIRNVIASLGIYALPVALMFVALALTHAHPWEQIQIVHSARQSLGTGSFFKLDRYGLILFTLALGVLNPWYSQIFWPILKSNVPGSELAPGGPEVHPDVPIPRKAEPFSLGPRRYLHDLPTDLQTEFSSSGPQSKSIGRF